MASDTRSPDLTHSALGAFPPAPMATSHSAPQATTALHGPPPQKATRIPRRQGRAPPCGPRASTTPHFLPTPILHRSAHLHFSNIHDRLSATIPASLRSRYKWGFRKDFTIPYGIVHLKEKKQWQKGRTIISYFHSLSGNLLRITSRALDIILQHLFPQHPGQLSIPQLWRHFHCYLTHTHTGRYPPTRDQR